MPIEFPVDHTALLEALRSGYGLEVTQLHFLGMGMVNSYRVEGPDGPCFLKLFPNTPYGQEAAARLEGEHALLLALKELRVLEHVPKPLHNRQGKTRSSLEGLPFAVYGFIEGQTIWDTWRDSVVEIATLLGHLHAGAPSLIAQNLKLPFAKEDFGLPFEARLLEDLMALRRTDSNISPGVQALKALLLPREAALLGVLNDAKRFQALARTKAHDFVVAHTDLHGGNLLLGQGGLWALDWETARVAPAEHDLWMYHSAWPEFIPAYEAALGQHCHIDADLIGFYMHRRNLEDLAMNVQQVIDGGRSDAQDAEDLEGIVEHGFEGWPQLKPDLKRAHHFLQNR